jgi:hypothetical protein
MNPSALDAEVQHHLKVRERERVQPRPQHKVPEMEGAPPGWLARLLGRRHGKWQLELRWKHDRRAVSPLK